MKANTRRGDWGPTWAAWWIIKAVLLFWPLLLGPVGVVIEVVWLVLVLGIAWLAVTGRRQVQRRRKM